VSIEDSGYRQQQCMNELLWTFMKTLTNTKSSKSPLQEKKSSENILI
jgi:hypothetical protein